MQSSNFQTGSSSIGSSHQLRRPCCGTQAELNVGSTERMISTGFGGLLIASGLLRGRGAADLRAARIELAQPGQPAARFCSAWCRDDYAARQAAAVTAGRRA